MSEILVEVFLDSSFIFFYVLEIAVGSISASLFQA